MGKRAGRVVGGSLARIRRERALVAERERGTVRREGERVARESRRAGLESLRVAAAIAHETASTFRVEWSDGRGFRFNKSGKRFAERADAATYADAMSERFEELTLSRVVETTDFADAA